MGDDGQVTPEDARRLAALREMLTATGAGIYLATHIAGPLAGETMAAMHESDDLELRLGRVGPERAEDMAQRDEEARAVLAAVTRVSPDRIVLTHGTAEGAALGALEVIAAPRAARGPRPQGSLVLVGALDRPVAAALEGAAAADGLAVVRASGPGAPLPDDVVLVAAPHVDRAGNVLDVVALAATARERSARLLLDASLACGALDTDYSTCGADIVLVAAHHWLLGPEGVAATWLGPAIGAEAPGRVRSRVSGFPRSTLLGVARSVGWLLMYVGVPWVTARTTVVAGKLRDGLAGVTGVEVIAPSPPAPAGPIVTFRVAGWGAGEAADELARRPFAILEADQADGVLRVSSGAWLRDEDVDRFVDAVAELARHSPSSLPRRATLSILHAGTDDR
jgi:selenocysteine lyase/cysteine desulfurase